MNSTNPGSQARNSGTLASQLPVTPKMPSTIPIIASELGLMWQSACSKIFDRLGINPWKISTSLFLSASNADFFKSSSGVESLRFLPTSTSNRLAALDPLPRKTKNSAAPATPMVPIINSNIIGDKPNMVTPWCSIRKI